MDPFQKHPGRLQDAEEDVANDHNVASRRQLRQTLATLSRTTGPSGAQYESSLLLQYTIVPLTYDIRRGKDLTDFLVEEARKLNRTYVTPAPETTGRGMRAYGEEAKEHEAPKMPYVAPPISHQSGNVPPEKQQQKSPAPVQTHLPPKKEKKWPPLESIGAPKVPKLQTRKEALSSPLPRVPTPSRLPVPILHPGYVRKRAAPKQQGLENEKSLTSPTSPAPIPPGKGSAAVARRRAELAQAGHFGPSRLPVFGQTQNKENASNIPQTPTPISQIPAHISQIPTRIPQVPTQIPHTPTHAPAEKPSVRERRKKPSLSINVPASLNINTPAHPSASTPPVRESNSPRKTPKTPKRHGTLVSPVDADFLRRQIESVIGPIQPSPPSPTTQQTVPALNFAPVSHCASIHNAESPRPGSSVYSFFPRTPHSSLVSTMGNTQSRPLERSAPRRASFDASYMAPGGSQLPLSAPRRNSEPSLGTYGSPLTAIQSTPGKSFLRSSYSINPFPSSFAPPPFTTQGALQTTFLRPPNSIILFPSPFTPFPI